MTIGREIIRLGRVASTMDVLDGLARAGEAEGLVVLAGEQTAGRGRAGRTWTASAGRHVLCSILLRPHVTPDRLGVLPLTVAVAVAETVEAYVPASCSLKWPNDVLVGGRKVAGILIQSRINGSTVEFVNLGIGINVDATRDLLPDGATSIAAEVGRDVGCDNVLSALTERLNIAYVAYLNSGGEPKLDGWRRRADKLGEQVSVVSGDRTLNGSFDGIDDEGRLLLRAESGDVIALAYGEVERGPRTATG